MLSYWEKQSLLGYDYIIIGGGIVGLSTAISLKERLPHASVLILEAGILPSGASTRNAGFACIGSLTEILDDLAHFPAAQVVELVKMRRDGLRRLRKRLGDEAIGYRESGSYELIYKEQLNQLNQLDQINQLLHPIVDGEAFSLCNDKIARSGFDRESVKAMVQNHFEGELDTGKMMRELTGKAIRTGVMILTGCYAERLEEKKDRVEVTVTGLRSRDALTFCAGKLAVCTNAFSRDLLPELDVVPGRGQVLITEPVSGLSFRGIYHFDRGYYYFREIDGRVLFGGGRNLDFEEETTTEIALNEAIQRDLEEKLRTMILPGRDFRIAQRWSGIMAFGKEKFPVIRQHGERIYLGVRMGGMGIAIGSEVGERLAAMISPLI